MHVGDDDVLDPAGVEADGLQPLVDRLEQRASAFPRHRRVESGVDHEMSPRADDGPDEIRERLEDVVRIAAEKILGGSPVMVPVPDGIDLMDVATH